jgi:hypothetical protein
LRATVVDRMTAGARKNDAPFEARSFTPLFANGRRVNL